MSFRHALKVGASVIGIISGALTPALISARAADITPAQRQFFEAKIRPIFADQCYKCHSHQAERVKAGLLLDTRDGLLKGGESGPAIVPGDPEKSLLIKAVRYTDPDLQMPPKGKKLSAAQVADLEAWVKMGAPDPRDKAPATTKAAKSWDEIVRERRTWWSLQPVKKPTIPTPKNAAWSAQPIDRFLLSAREA
ncbi:MAG TPA: c-type cytochrome domain-containing protein, partial [Verrucomicrobiae bacterium]|nr:c-type cytochrome domain-containing protein [Verrucomicrobiae bacterium]